MSRIQRTSAWALLLAIGWMLLPLALLATPLWDWPINNWKTLTWILIGFVAAFGLGGFCGLLLIERLPIFESTNNMAKSNSYWLTLSITLSMNILTLLFRASFNPFTCGNILECSNAAYQGYVEGSASGVSAQFEYIRILMAPIIYSGIAISIWVLLFPSDKYSRYLGIIVIVSEISIAIATGTSRNLANIILFGLFVVMLKSWVYPAKKVLLGRRIFSVLLAFIIVIVFFVYFSFLQINRDGLVAAIGLMGFNGGYIEAYSFRVGSDNFLLKGVESVVRYLSTGYFSFSLALDLVANQTFPIGASQFLAMRFARNGDDFYVLNSLPGQIESHYGWSYLQQWHSLFSWLMSDYSIFSVALIMAVCGFIFVTSIYVAFSSDFALGKLPIMLLFILILYVPANNQIFQSPETAICFFASIVIIFYALWRATRDKVEAAAPGIGGM